MVSRDGGICSVFFLWRLTVRRMCLMDGCCDAVDCGALDTAVLITCCAVSCVSVALRLIADVT